jgi:VanZ family protein
MLIMNGSERSQRAASYLLLGYCLFILYGSFIPFRFNLDPNFIRSRWETFLLELARQGRPRASLPDVVSNILLFVPFGMLCSARLRKPGARQKRLPLTAWVCGLILGAAIESGQTLAPGRNPSPIDALCNSLGALLGGLFADGLLRTLGKLSVRKAVQRLTCDLPLLITAYLIIGIILVSFYPFAVTLDLSSIWQNIKHSQFLPLGGSTRPELLFEKVAVFAALGYFFRLSLHRDTAGAAFVWLCCGMLALAVEGAKLFIVGRTFSIQNVVAAWFGASLGVLLVRFGTARLWKHPQGVCLGVLIGFLLYLELTPFDWIAPGQLLLRIAAIEWLPFMAYYSAEPLSALFDLQRKVYWFIPLGFAVMPLALVQRAPRPRRRALLICLLISVTFELLQIAVATRTASSTDVIIFSASAAAGIYLFELRRRACVQC